MQKTMKDNIDLTMKSIDKMSKGMQAMAVEATDYSKKSAEDASKMVEELMGAKSFDVALALQSDYFKKSYEGAVSQMTKMTEMYMDLSKDMSKPYEAMTAKFGK
ncbi:phasin family protein [Hartmannibacter diazotrophicus]|nr:phasin family protein [Hartmannibacter diazotrophicus]